MKSQRLKKIAESNSNVREKSNTKVIQSQATVPSKSKIRKRNQHVKNSKMLLDQHPYRLELLEHEPHIKPQSEGSGVKTSTESVQNVKLRKCVVKLKRLPVPKSVTSSPLRVSKCVQGCIESGSKRRPPQHTIKILPPRKSRKLTVTEKSQIEMRTPSPSIRKCVVRLKRISMPFSGNLSETTSKASASDEQPCSEANTEMTKNRPLLESNCPNEDFDLPSPARNASEYDVTRFEPVRNSTVCDFEHHSNSTQNREQPDESTLKKLPQRNYIKDPKLIESILLSEEVNANDTVEEVNLEDVQASGAPKDAIIDESTQAERTRAAKIFKRNRYSKKYKKSSPKETENIFEFSLTQTSDGNKNDDPTADVIKKLIAEGKVNVATMKKGKGRPVLKRKRMVQGKFVKAAKSNKNKLTADEQATAQIRQYLPKRQKDNSEAIFSNLARRVLVQEAEKHTTGNMEVPIENINYVSTPLHHNVLPCQELNWSPIYFRTTPQLTSPWRFSYGDALEQNSRNLSDVPSLHTDNIPSPTNKDITNSKRMSKLNISIPFRDTTSPQKNYCGPPYSPSSSSNDSNAENIPPQSDITGEKSDINSNIFNRRVLPNPLQSIPAKKRNPLQAINVLEIINLPPWKPHEPTNEINRIDKDSNAKATSEELFGFEEYLDEDNDVYNTVAENANESIDKESLHARLQSLRKWRPAESEIKPSSQPQIKGCLFEDGDKPQQRTIKEMLCSTMINREKSNATAKEPRHDVQTNPKHMGQAETLEEETELFGESFQRTYARPKKKKRKMRHNFVMFLDSDYSSDEEEQEQDHSPAKKERKRNKKDDVKTNEELESFVNEFNDMCKDVETYTLVVE